MSLILKVVPQCECMIANVCEDFRFVSHSFLLTYYDPTLVVMNARRWYGTILSNTDKTARLRNLLRRCFLSVPLRRSTLYRPCLSLLLALLIFWNVVTVFASLTIRLQLYYDVIAALTTAEVFAHLHIICACVNLSARCRPKDRRSGCRLRAASCYWSCCHDYERANAVYNRCGDRRLFLLSVIDGSCFGAAVFSGSNENSNCRLDSGGPNLIPIHMYIHVVGQKLTGTIIRDCIDSLLIESFHIE